MRRSSNARRAILREVVQSLNEPAVDSAWGDDMTQGWGMSRRLFHIFHSSCSGTATALGLGSGAKVVPE